MSQFISFVKAGLLCLALLIVACKADTPKDNLADFDVVRLITVNNADCTGIIVDTKTVITTKFCLQNDIIGIDQAPNVEIVGYTYQSSSDLVLLIVDEFSSEQQVVSIAAKFDDNQAMNIYGYDCDAHVVYENISTSIRFFETDNEPSCQSSGDAIFDEHDKLVGVVVDQNRFEDLSMVNKLLQLQKQNVDNSN